MATEVILPKVDMDMATGTISRWHVEDGMSVKKGQAIFDIETDKAAMEIEAPVAGIIKIGNPAAGETLPIGTIVAMIYGPGEYPKPLAAVTAAQETAPPSSATTNPAKAVASASTDFRQDKNDAHSVRRATPLARRLAREAGLDLAGVSGSGPRGCIVAADVTSAHRLSTAKGSLVVAIGAELETQAVKAMYAEGSYDLKPLDGMRRTIAQRLTQSKQTVPHFYLSATCTIDRLLQTRERLNVRALKSSDGKAHYKLSINDFIIKALALALQQVPDANVTYTDGGILQHRSSDVGVAVSVDGGLFTPIIRNTETKALTQISGEMKDLAARARARKLQPSEYQGGSAAISNLGMFGVETFTAIINPPQASILAVGAAVERFIPINKQPVLATQISVTLSCDHRAVDGAVGARLLQAFQSFLEDPALMLV